MFSYYANISREVLIPLRVCGGVELYCEVFLIFSQPLLI